MFRSELAGAYISAEFEQEAGSSQWLLVIFTLLLLSLLLKLFLLWFLTNTALEDTHLKKYSKITIIIIHWNLNLSPAMYQSSNLRGTA